MQNSNISHRIRRQLDQPGGMTADTMAPLAAEYTREVAEVNQRLSEAVKLLRKGLRSEAIQRASMQPNVLDWSTALDFPELDDWIAILQFLSVDVPPAIDRDAAMQLQQAIVEEQPLEELLRQHRRLAIAKAPLPWRLKVLRRIQQEDSLNSVWLEDIESWETVRLKQLPSELTAAIESKTLEDCQNLHAELSNPSWRVKPSKELIQKAANAARDLTFRSQVDQLSAIADDLHGAYGEGNEAAARKHRDSWKNLVDALVMPAPADLQESVEPALEWLSQCDEQACQSRLHEAATARLEKLIGESKSAGDLEQAYFGVQKYDLGLDPILEQRFLAKLSQLKQSSKRKYQFTFFTVTAAAICVVVALALFQSNRSFNNAVQTVAAELQGMLDKEMFKEADDYRKRIEGESPKVLASPTVEALVAKLNSNLSTEAKRQAEWLKLIEQAYDGATDKLNLPLLIEAEKIARLPEELTKTKEIRRIADRQEQMLQQEQFEKVRSAVQDIELSLNQIEKQDASERLYEHLDEVAAKISSVRNEFPKCGARGVALLDASQKRTSGLRQAVATEIMKDSQKKAALNNIRIATTLQAYAEELEKFVGAFPADPLTADYRSALNEKRFWHAPLEWNVWLDELNAAKENGIDKTEASKLAASFKILDAKIPANFALRPMPNLGLYLSSYEGNEEVLQQLITTLSTSILNDLITLTGKVDGQQKRYFAYDTYRISKERSWAILKDTTRTGVEVMKENTGEVGTVTLEGKITISLHPKKFIQGLVRQLEASKSDFATNADSHLSKMIAGIAFSPDLDVKVKMLLLSNVLEIAFAQPSKVTTELNAIRESLTELRESYRNWQEPIEFTATLSEQLNSEISLALRRLQQSIGKEQSALTTIQTLKYEWVGTVVREADNTLSVTTKASQLPDGYLVICVPRLEDPDTCRIEKIGTLRNQQPALQAGKDVLVGGQPVFLLPTKVNQ